MTVFLNGEFVREERALISAFDRGFLYGDGLFEGIRVFNGKPFRWKQHLERFQHGADFLKISVPFAPEAMSDVANRLIEENRMLDSLLRLTLSRGVGPRGYSPKGAGPPTFLMSLYPMPAVDPANPPCWRVVASSLRLLTNEPLARFKNTNKLPQILARAEADTAGADEALLLNSDGYVVEGTTSNLFWIKNGGVCTPPLPAGILPGVTRAVILELCRNFGLRSREQDIVAEELVQVEGVFLSMSSVGIAEVALLDGKALTRSPIVKRLGSGYWETVRKECA
jgi:aminodeoxychorismate lyase